GPSSSPSLYSALWRFLWPAAPLYAAYFSLRWTYYDQFLPNTFTVKTGGGFDQLTRGLIYLLTAGWDSGLLLWAAWGMLSYVMLARGSGAAVRLSQPHRLLLALLLAYLAYIAAVGGDAFGPRFLAHLFPVAAALAFSSAPRALASRPARAALTAALLLPVAMGLRLYAMEFAETRFSSAWAAAGRHLAAVASPGATLATDAAGALPYFSGLPTIDRHGLNDRVVASTPAIVGSGRPGHERYNDAYVLALRPTYLGCWRHERERLTCDVEQGASLDPYRPALLAGMWAAPAASLVLTAPPEGADAAWVAAAWDTGYRYLVLQRIAGR
ncbi:MAG: hypothetical protein NTZ05_20575, partial [Chloroflexi bacterium]|nr:hypothetical protein [Chloroflexota bacterium]